MKIKRFNNLWAMGLILCGALLIAFYVAKIFFPEFIIGVAETPQIVEFGNLIDSNIIYRNIFDFVSNVIMISVYFCACSRIKMLNLKSFSVVLLYALLLRLSSKFFIGMYASLNFAGLVFCPLIISLIHNNICKKTYISMAICYSVDILTQGISLQIRDITLIANTINTATFFVLLIDALIWRCLLYCYFNYKKGDIYNG